MASWIPKPKQLDPVVRQAIDARLAGKSHVEIAETVGKTVWTVRRWFNSPDVKSELTRLTKEIEKGIVKKHVGGNDVQAKDLLKESAPEMAALMLDIARDVDNPPKLRAETAEKCLRLSGITEGETQQLVVHISDEAFKRMLDTAAEIGKSLVLEGQPSDLQALPEASVATA